MSRPSVFAALAAALVLVGVVAAVGSPTSAAPLAPKPTASTAAPSSASAWAGSTAQARVKSSEAAEHARKAFEQALARYATGQGTLEEAVLWSERARDYHKDYRAARTGHRDRLLRLEKEAKKRVQGGSATTLEETAAAYHRAQAEAEALY